MPSPLVSILIRSLGRPSLAASVGSVFAQTHRPIDLVIVNVGGRPIERFALPPDMDLHVVDAEGLDRPRAANAALAAAAGEWLVFLDDDDVHLPSHVESLLNALHDEDDALLAYSATDCVDAAGKSVKILSKPFDRLALHEGNYLQIGAALFSRRLVDEGYRFDEAFHCLQDWDFWLQLAQRTRFVFSAMATNRWSAFSGASGCGMGENSDSARYGPYSRMLAAKWGPHALDLQRRVRHHRALGQLATQRGHLEAAARHANAVEAMLRGAPPRARATSRPTRPASSNMVTRA